MVTLKEMKQAIRTCVRLKKWLICYLKDEIRGLDHAEADWQGMKMIGETISLTCPCDGVALCVPLTNIKAYAILDEALNPHAATEYLRRLIASKYCQCTTNITDKSCLVGALEEIYGEGNVEVHTKPQPLIGYMGDKRQEKATIIVRKQNVGPGSNDIGYYKQPDGTYGAHVSEYDKTTHFSAAKQNLVKQLAAKHAILKTASVYKKAAKVTKVGGKIKIKVTI